MCVIVQAESEFNELVFLKVETNSGKQNLDINKEDIKKTVRQLFISAYALLDIANQDCFKYEKAMSLLENAQIALNDA